jgi:hypothetical protein
MDFAFLLANASIPAGIEIRERDSNPATTLLDYSHSLSSQVAAADVVRSFNAEHSDYRASIVDGVFVIRPVNGTAHFLDQPSSIDHIVTVDGPMAALRRVFAQLDPRLLGPVLNSYEGEHAAKVVLNGSAAHSVLQMLGQVTKQTKKTWQVVIQGQDQTWRIVAIGLIYPNGQRRTQRLAD